MKLESIITHTLIVVTAVAGYFAISDIVDMSKSEEAITSKVVQIVGGGSCSGQQVRAPSGIDYILSAGHCKVLEKDGSYTIITADNRKMQRKLVAEDPNSDLLLIEGVPNLKGMTLADSLEFGQHVRTYTHGQGYRTYRTDGVIVDKRLISIGLYIITNQEDHERCSMPKNTIERIETIFGPIEACFLTIYETVSTAKVVPGSSGGAVVDDHGDLVAIVSAGDFKNGFGFFIDNIEIAKFLNNY